MIPVRKSIRKEKNMKVEALIQAYLIVRCIIDRELINKRGKGRDSKLGKG